MHFISWEFNTWVTVKLANILVLFIIMNIIIVCAMAFPNEFRQRLTI